MKITVINYSNKQGITYELKKIFLEDFKNDEITEFYLIDEPIGYCTGCTNCFLKDEKYCKDYESVKRINDVMIESDLLVFAYPTYAFHTPAPIKNLLDHLGFQWIIHRPNKKMFNKRAVIITQCMGGGTKSAIKDVKDSLSWWGVSKIYTYQASIRDKSIIWKKITQKRKDELTEEIKELSGKIKNIDFKKSPRVSMLTKIKFLIAKRLQISLNKNKNLSADAIYWKENGWLGKNRPW